MTICWVCQRSEADSGKVLAPDGAHASCPRRAPQPSTYVPKPERFEAWHLLHIQKQRPHRGGGGRPRLFRETAS